MPPRIFRETVAVAVGPWLEAKRFQKFLFAKRGLQQSFKPRAGGNDMAAVRPDDNKVGVKGRADRRLFGRRIEVAAAPADRAAGAGLDMADMLQRAGQERESGLNEVRRQHVTWRVIAPISIPSDVSSESRRVRERG